MSTPTNPVKAYHRILLHMIQSFHGDAKLAPRPEELDRITRVFLRAGGSWERFYDGSVQDVDLLKRLLKVAVVKGCITKAPRWGG